MKKLLVLTFVLLALGVKAQPLPPNSSGSNFYSVVNNNTFILSNGVPTNFTIYTLSNPGPTGVMFTNDIGNAVNSAQNVFMNFFGASSTNIPQIEATGTLGLYGEMYWNTTHDNPAGRPQDVEFAITSINRIAIVPDLTGIGDDPAVQLGGTGVASRWFINYATNTVTQIGSSPSQGFLLRSAYRTNGSTFIVAPELVSSTVSNVAGKGWDSHLYIDHESGTWGNETGTPDVNLGIPGIDLEMNTNSGGLYTGVIINGRTNGGITSSIALTGTQVLVSSNLVAKNYASDQWQGPGIFTAGGTAQNNASFNVSVHNVAIGTASGADQLQVFNGSGGYANGYLFSGNGGNWMPNQGLVIGNMSAGNFTAAGNGNLVATNSAAIGTNGASPAGTTLFLGGNSTIYASSNTAPGVVVSSSGLHTIALNKTFTNDLGCRASLFITSSYPGLFTNKLVLTNTTSGEEFDYPQYSQINISQSNTVSMPVMSPGDVCAVCNYVITAGAVSSISKAWLKTQ